MPAVVTPRAEVSFALFVGPSHPTGGERRSRLGLWVVWRPSELSEEGVAERSVPELVLGRAMWDGAEDTTSGTARRASCMIFAGSDRCRLTT